MAVSFSKIAGIKSSDLMDKGAFDPILNIDTRLFIDPHLLKHSEIEEFSSSYSNLHDHFKKIGKLLLASDSKGDVFWNKADMMMQWSEVKGLCIGYSSKSTCGSGIGPELRARLLETSKTIIDKGVFDEELFELVGMFQKDFGADRISDMTANIIRNDLKEFTLRILSELGIKLDDFFEIDETSGLPINPFTSDVIYLVPLTLLRDLPVALDWSNRDKVLAQNEELRSNMNELVGRSWREVTFTTTKDNLKKCVQTHPELIKDLIQIYKSKPPQYYDFQYDRAGEFIWVHISKLLTDQNPISLKLSEHPSIDEVEELVLCICAKFKSLIENNGLNQFLYDKDGKPKNESAAQLLFYGVAESYCEANKILLSRESNSGRGPVDFKFGTNMENSVLVEIKKSTNTSGLKKGIEKQLPEYMKSEKSKRAIYLVIDVGFTKAAIKRLNDINKKISGAAIKVLNVDGIIRSSASKL